MTTPLDTVQSVNTTNEKTINPYTEHLKSVKSATGEEIPFLKDLWSFFSSKGVKTNFFSINPDESFILDLDICESLGCPVRVLTNSAAIETKWSIIASTLKARAIAPENANLAWLEGIQKRWILPRNLILKRTALEWSTLATEAAAIEGNRVDMLKIEGSQEEERAILYSLTDSGFRPGVVLVRYTYDPDENVPSMLVAGHLQMIGYRLVECKGPWFLYLFEDNCFYDSCSWRTTTCQNPLSKYIAGMGFVEGLKYVEDRTAASVTSTVNTTPIEKSSQ
jgi:hypothetical protein